MPSRPPIHRPYRQQPVERNTAYDEQYNETKRNPTIERWRSSYRWQNLRAVKLAKDPLCEVCDKEGRITQAVQVHHVVGANEDLTRFFDYANLESICTQCHARHNATERRTKRAQA